VSEVIAETTNTAADVAETRPGDMNVVFTENHEVHEQFAQLARAVQVTLAASPAHESDHEPFVVYGLCMCVPQPDMQNGAHTHARQESPNMNVLLLATRADDQHAMKVMEVEGSESAETRRALRNLLGAMQKALAGDPEDAPHGHEDAQNVLMAGETPANGSLPHQKLSEREFQVVHMLSKGKTVGAISKELNLSVKTVSTYRVRALKKMNFKTNAELIRYMIQYKLG
jgi:DNA-binding NarL/FixJ family response regulator